MLALRGRSLIASTLSNIEFRQMRLVQAQALAEASAADWALVTRIDPSNVIAWNNWSASQNQAIGAMWQTGRVREAIERLVKTRAELEPHVGHSTMLADFMVGTAFFQSWALSEAGETGRADAAFGLRQPWLPIARASLRPDSFDLESRKCLDLERRAFISRIQLNWAATREQSRPVLACLDKIRPSTELERRISIDARREALLNLALAALANGEDSQAEQQLRTALVAARDVPQDALDEQQRTIKENLWLALAVARQGRRDEARALIGPVVAFERRMRTMPGSADMYEHAHLSAALAVAALAEPPGPGRKEFLSEARSNYDRLCTECRGTNTVKWIARWIEEAAH
jgi:hypothetical protein